MSESLFKKLSTKEEKSGTGYGYNSSHQTARTHSSRPSTAPVQELGRDGMTYDEWVRRKDAEKRLKKKLL